MSKLDRMIEKLCPNGVEYKTLSNICTISRGVRVIKNQLTDYGKYPVYQNSMTPLGYYDKSNCAPKTAFIISAGAAGEIGYSENEFWAADDCIYFQCPQNLQSRFLYFALLCQQDYLFSRVRKASVVCLDFNDVKAINDEIIYHCKRWIFSKKQLKSN